MPRFHFDVRTDGVTEVDEEGLDLLSEETARLEAARAAAEMLRDRAGRRAETADIEIIARDGNRELFRVSVAMKIANV
jgi:hypothetical protein